MAMPAYIRCRQALVAAGRVHSMLATDEPTGPHSTHSSAGSRDGSRDAAGPAPAKAAMPTMVLRWGALSLAASSCQANLLR